MKKILTLLTILFISLTNSHVYAAGLSIAPKELVIGINTSANLKITSDSDILFFSSSNPSVVNVYKGVITGLSLGDAFITVSDSKGNKDICNVKVVKNYIPIQKIEVSNLTEEILLNTKKQIKVNIFPSNASNQTLTYYTNYPEIVSVSDTGIITGKKVGIAYVIIKAPGTDQNISLTVKVVDKVSIKSISMRKNLDLKEKTSYKLTVNFVPSNSTNKKLTWKSKNNAIASVDKFGNVTANGVGTTEIYAISNDGGYVATCRVNVIKSSDNDSISDGKSEEKELLGLSLNKNSLSMKVNTEETLEVIYEPHDTSNKKVFWSSSSESVVQVVDGKLKALKPGTSVIKVVSEDGKKEATCKVVVVSSELEAISFPQKEEIVYIDSETVLKVIPTPKDANYSDLLWTSSMPSVATIENGVLKSLSLGTTTITVSNSEGTIKDSVLVKVINPPKEDLMIQIEGYHLDFNPDTFKYDLTIGNENTLKFIINEKDNKVVINGNKDLKDGSIITITISDKVKKTYIFNIHKKKNYTIYFIAIISVLLLLNVIRMIVKNKKVS